MLWEGKKELVVGEVDENGKIVRQFRIQPGDEIPEEAVEMIRAAGESVTNIPYDSNGGYSKKFVEDAYLSGDPEKFYRQKLQ